MDKDAKIMIMTILISFATMLIMNACSVVSVQIVGRDGNVEKVVDPADNTIGLTEPVKCRKYGQE